MSEAVGLLMPQSCRPIRLGGVGGLTGIDIAHACTMTGDIGYALLNIKYNNDRTYSGALLKLMEKRIKNEMVKENWKRARIPALLMLASNEYCGNYIYEDKQRAALIGVSPSCWCRVWKSKYSRVLEILEYSEQSILHHIRNKLR